MTRWDPLDTLDLSLARGACEIALVRHADAVPEAELAPRDYDDYAGHALSERGRAQALAVAQRFAGSGLAAVYSSPILRARETAQAIAQRAGLDVRDEHGLHEVEIGALDGGEMSLRERLAALATIALRDGSWSVVPGTETSNDVRARMVAALGAIAARHPGARVAAVSHAGSINAYLGELAGSTHDFLFPLANAGVSVVRVNGARRLLMSANETLHLRNAERAAS